MYKSKYEREGLPSEFKQSPAPRLGLPRSRNSTQSFSGFHLSYNPYCSMYRSETTALVLEQRVFLVLNGNHALALQERAVASGLHGCMEYFIEHKDQANSIGEHLMVFGIQKDPFGLVDTTVQLLGQESYDKFVAAFKQEKPNEPA